MRTAIVFSQPLGDVADLQAVGTVNAARFSGVVYANTGGAPPPPPPPPAASLTGAGYTGRAALPKQRKSGGLVLDRKARIVRRNGLRFLVTDEEDK